MNKTELITKVSEGAGISKKEADAAVNTVFASIIDALTNEEKVQLLGFGTFEVRARSAREGLNPHTKETIHIPASKAPAFKPGKAFKDAINK